MSNEYKDWERDTIEEQKQVIEKYPFLRARNIDGTIDTESKFPMMFLEIPDGWYKLFFQMCDDIKPLLEKEGVMDDFYFIQCKEKFNSLRCYSNGTASQEVEDIIAKYEHMAYYVCTVCGKPATCVSTGYWASFCDDCWKDHFRHEHMDWIEFKPYYRVTGFAKGEHYDKTISFEDEWNRYLKENGYDTV
jgi:hypothetical protein